MTRQLTRLAIVVLTLVALGVLMAGCAPASPAPTVSAAPTVAAQPTKAAAPAPTILPAATQAATAAPATQPAPTATKALAAPTATATAAAAKSGTVSFAKDVLPIFEQNCIKCHGGTSTEQGLALKTYAQLMKGSDNGQVLKPGDSKNSFLVQQLMNGKMPKRAPKLPQAQIDLIAAWVDAGAPNN